MSEYSSITLLEVRHYADLCKKSTREDAEVMHKFLLQRALETGVTSPEILEAIQSIRDRFIEEDRKTRQQLIEEELRRRGTLSIEHIDADDDQIISAIKKTLPKFESDRDWAGVYRILVDYCHFLPKFSDFVKRLDKMGIYPTDDVVKGIERRGIPSISVQEYHDHKFSYQALQKGIGTGWPDSYVEWMNSQKTDRDFICRRNIATTFLNNLKRIVKP